MKADLHFHPSFFSPKTAYSWLKNLPGRFEHVTERRTPSLYEVAAKAVENLDLLAVTSCSSKDHQDLRWQEYQRQAQQSERTFELRHPQMIVFHTGNTPVSGYEPGVIYLIHGQELKTDVGGLNVLFAEQNVPIQKTDGTLEEVLRAARDSGDNVLIGINELSRFQRRPAEIELMYEDGKIDFLEMWNALAILKWNLESYEIAEKTHLPRIAVSDAHRIHDVGSAHIYNSATLPNDLTYEKLAKKISQDIRTQNFGLHEGEIPFSGKALYSIRLGEAILGNQVKKLLPKL